jgi:hypothetical protein
VLLELLVLVAVAVVLRILAVDIVVALVVQEL